LDNSSAFIEWLFTFLTPKWLGCATRCAVVGAFTLQTDFEGHCLKTDLRESQKFWLRAKRGFNPMCNQRSSCPAGCGGGDVCVVNVRCRIC
jgi:hypothetical protein